MSNANQTSNAVKPLVSVIVCTYQHVNYIERCLDGILNQVTDFPYEIILGEDESSDGTREKCIKYAANFPDKIKLFLRSRDDVMIINQRPTGRFNFISCYKECKGKYIAVCDGDDAWTDTYKLQKQVFCLEKNSQYSVSCHNAILYDSKGNCLNEKLLAENCRKDMKSEELICGKHLSLSSVMFRNMLGNFPPEFSKVLNADTFIFMLLGFHGDAKFLTGIKDNIYTCHNASIWSSRSFYQQQFDKNLLYKTMYQYCRRVNYKKRSCILKKYMGTNRNLIIMSLNKNSRFDSAQFMCESLLFCMKDFRFMLGLKQMRYFFKNLLRLA